MRQGSQQLRLGIDATCFANRRGYGRFAREIVRALVKIAPDLSYHFYTDAQSPVPGDITDAGTAVVVQTARPQTEAARAGGSRPLSDMLAMSRAVNRVPLDVFFFPTVYTYFPLMKISKDSWPRAIVTIHDAIPEAYPRKVFPDLKSRVFWSIKRRLACAQSKTILTVSQYSKRQIEKFLGIKGSVIEVVSEAPSPVFKRVESDEAKAKVLEKIGLGLNNPFVLYAGGIGPHKNIEELVKAHAQVTKDEKWKGLRLVIAGDYEKDVFLSSYEVLRKMIDELDSKGLVVFTGFVEDPELAALYSQATLVVLPSLMEGYGLPAIEAASCGAPVVATKESPLPEILGEGVKTFDPAIQGDLGRMLAETLADPIMLKEMAAKGMEMAGALSWEKSARSLLDTIEKLGDARVKN